MVAPTPLIEGVVDVPATTQSGTTYTLDADDVGSQVILSNAGLVTVTVPTDAATPIAVGSRILLFAAGAGGVTLTTTGLTLNGSAPMVTVDQNQGLWLEKTATDTWTVLGGTS